MGLVLDLSADCHREGEAQFRFVCSSESAAANFLAAAEFLLGVERALTAARRAKRAAFAEKRVTSIPIFNYDLAVARRHASLWAALATSGNLLGPYDQIIAASVLEYGCSLATLNGGEFSRVPASR